MLTAPTVLVLIFSFTRHLSSHFSHTFMIQKIGRNDPCPSGIGQKFKKCLAGHSCLAVHQTPADIWWVCERWQVQEPTTEELLDSLKNVQELLPVKMEAFLDFAIAESPSNIKFWNDSFHACVTHNYEDLLGVFRKIKTHLCATENVDRSEFYASVAKALNSGYLEIYHEVLAAFFALKSANTQMEPLVSIATWAIKLDRIDDCERLREHFELFPHFLLNDEAEESEYESEDHTNKEPDFPAEVTDAINEAWDDFESIDSPTYEQANAFLDLLLVQPAEAVEWSEVFDEIMRIDHSDIFKIFYRIADELPASSSCQFSFICWSIAEFTKKRQTPERLLEIADRMVKFNPESCDPTALSGVFELLLTHGFITEAIDLVVEFLPFLRTSKDVMNWVVPSITKEIFLLRLGLLISSNTEVDQDIESLHLSLCDGMMDEIDQFQTHGALQYLMQDRETFTRESFILPISKKQTSQQEIIRNKLFQAFVEIARDAWQTDHRNPSLTLIGLHMIWQAAESAFKSPKKKGKTGKNGKKPEYNLFDYIEPAALESLILAECQGFIGINYERAKIMIDASFTLILWSERQGFVPAIDRLKTEEALNEWLNSLGYS